MATKRKRKAAAVTPSTDHGGIDRSWRARDDLRTLSSAAEISRDKSRLGAAKAEARKQMQALSKVAGGGPRSSGKSRRERLEDVQL